MPSTRVKTAAASVAALALLPSTALAANAPTITSSPNPTTTGDPVVIYGAATPGANVVLYHRINPKQHFSVIQHTKADSAGRYEFTRADGVVSSNRNWYVKVNGVRSSTVHQKVSALIKVNAPEQANIVTGRDYKFAGRIDPAGHKGEKVELQRQASDSTGDSWTTIDSARIQGGGRYVIKHRFVNPGDANIRVHFDGDARNVASDSELLTYGISQKQHKDLTINSSVDPLTVGQGTVISGKLAGVSVPTPVTLYSHTAGRGYTPTASTMTDSAGNYSFATQSPIASTFYQVRGANKSSAQLFEGAKMAVNANVNSTSVTAGDTLTFTGTVSPDKTGHVVYLERRDADGTGWHVVQRSKVNAGSTIAIAHRVTVPGTKVFRIFVPGGAVNSNGSSGPITVTVAANSAPLAS